MKTIDLMYVFAMSFIFILYCLGHSALVGLMCPITAAYFATCLFNRLFHRG